MDETGTVNVRGRRDFHAKEDEEGCDDGRGHQERAGFPPTPVRVCTGPGSGVVLREQALLEPGSAGASSGVGRIVWEGLVRPCEQCRLECEDGCLLTAEHRLSGKSQRTRKVRMRIGRGNDDLRALRLEPGQGWQEPRPGWGLASSAGTYSGLGFSCAAPVEPLEVCGHRLAFRTKPWWSVSTERLRSFLED